MSRNRSSSQPNSRHSLSAVEALCLVVVLLVLVFVGKGVLGHRNASPPERGSVAQDGSHPTIRQASVLPGQSGNLVYRPKGSASDAFDDEGFDDDPFEEYEDDPFAEEPEAESTPSKPAQLIQLRPVAPGQADPVHGLQETSLDPGPVIHKPKAVGSGSVASSKPTSSNALKAYKKAQKSDRKGSKYVGGKGSVKNARKDKRSNGGLADNQGNTTLLPGEAGQEPELVDPQVQLNSFYEALKNPEVSSSGLRKYMANLTAAELPAALEAISQQVPDQRTSYAVDELFRAWGKADPISALNYADDYESIRTRNSAIASTLGSWAKERPHEALNWYLENLESDPRAKQLNVGYVFRELAKVDMNDALMNARGLPDERMRQSAYNYIFEGIDKEGRVSTLDNLYHQAANSQERKEIANMIVRDQARYEPYEAARYVTSLDDPEAQRAALNTLVYTWSADRPDQTVEFVNRINDAELREKHLGSTMRNWVRYDPEAALTWLDSQPPAGDMDAAYGSAVYNFRENDPEEAIYWAEQVQDEKKQSSYIKSVAKTWLKTDPEAARTYIATSPTFSEKDRARYLAIPVPVQPGN